ncbi:hypothetical protein [Micromonospora sp. NPDC049301]|uniref:hypothetical protein n=1 Tax=Micromonospora sp. NPDC049301 TaxID=3155723 RepID=UPI00341566E1
MNERLGWVADRVPTPDRAPAFVAESLLAWRRWLESLAERLDQILPSLDPERAVGAAEVAAAWEAAIGKLMMFTVAPVADDDGWQGWCELVLRWLLTATGVPPQQALALVEGAFGKRFDNWVPLTATDIGDIAERITRGVLSPAAIVPASRVDNWPDTWPQGWPSWRATNTGRGAGPPSDRGHSR